jgi:glucose/arabinose dehydrogenase
LEAYKSLAYCDRVRRLGILAGAVATIACVGACASDGSRAEQGSTATRTAAAGRQAPAAGDAAARRGLRLLPLGRFDQPTYLAAPPGDTRRRFVVERPGRIVVVRDGRTRPFLDIRSQVSTEGEGGLLSMAFAPDYARSGRFYVYYTDTRGYPTIAQYRRAAGSAERVAAGSKRIVLSVAHHNFNHKGGQIQFGPDGKLYAAFGDGGGGGDPDHNAQNLGRLLGKLIRIEPQPGGGYRVPADSPFRGRPGARPEIFAYGLRNPYRFSFDRATGGLTIGDVGQDAVEEIDYVPGRSGGRAPAGGQNFGWNVFEGRSRYSAGRAPGYVPPVITHGHDAGWCSIIGGYVIRDRSLGSDVRGRYVYGDNCRSQLQLARLRAGGARTRGLALKVPGLVSFGEDARGRVYAVSLNGPVYRLAPR